MKMESAMKFTYDSYENLLATIHNCGYTFTDYERYANHASPCILRHDIDNDMEKCMEMAQLENDVSQRLGVPVVATYFVLLNTNFYNLFSSENRNRLKQLITMGHKIGLHFDEKQYDIGGDDVILVEKILEELSFLTGLCGKPIDAVSMHRPSKDLIERNVQIPGAVNSYSHTFFKEFKYFSDSRMHWREDVIAGVQSGVYDRLHVLTHPFWYEHDDHSAKESLWAFLKKTQIRYYDWFNDNFRSLDEFIKRDEVVK